MSAGNAQSGKALWLCDLCETLNPDGVARCAVCGALRAKNAQSIIADNAPPVYAPPLAAPEAPAPRYTPPPPPPAPAAPSAPPPPSAPRIPSAPSAAVFRPAPEPVKPKPSSSPPSRVPAPAAPASAPPKPHNGAKRFFILLLAAAELAFLYLLYCADQSVEPFWTGLWLPPQTVHTDGAPVAIRGFSPLRAMEAPSLSDRVYAKGASDVDVLWAQAQLRALGYFQKEGCDPTGCMDKSTVKELSRFQKDMALPDRSGKLDQATVDALLSTLYASGGAPEDVLVGGFYDELPIIPAEGLKTGDTGIAVEWAQRCLTGLGLDPWGADGDFGRGTAQAVRELQKECGFQETGRITYGLLREMARLYIEIYGELP